MVVSGPGMAMLGGAAPVPAFSTLATDKVRVVGDPVVLVVAESRYLAEDACELVEVDYDELPAVVTEDAALDPGSPPIFEDLGTNRAGPFAGGDLRRRGRAFARADRVVRADRQHRHQNVPWKAADASPASTPVPESSPCTRRPKASTSAGSRRHAPGHAPEKVRVLAGDIGGSFGLKIGAAREDIAVAAASRALGRPVKWIEDRNENLTVSGQAREESFEVEAAVTNDGDILGLKVKMIVDTGAYPGMGAMSRRSCRG